MEEKIKKLASTIVNHSIKVQEGENVKITSETMEPMPLIKELVKQINDKKANVVVSFFDPLLRAMINKDTTDEKIELLRKMEKFEVENHDSFIRIFCNQGDYINSIVPDEVNIKIGEALREYRDIRVNERKWVLLNYPSKVDSQKAKMNTDEFTNFSFDAMCYDYSLMLEDLKPLKELMEKTDKVRLTGEGTDITFSIKDIPVIPCVGEMNIPDGEIYTAPVKDSINGVIRYNTPSPYQGNVYNNVSLTFENGKIIKATCDGDNEMLNKVFDTDEGARYVGEFSLGLNPKILHPMGDILFDEKIIGSIHFTPGQAYEDAFNGNNSGIHWDMVLVQRKEYGGGEIYFDHQLIRKDGLFVLPELSHLNYDLK